MKKQQQRNRGAKSSYRSAPKQREGIFSAFRQPFEFAEEAQLQLTGNKSLYIEGCKEVLEYDDCYIKLSLGKTMLTVVGAELVVETFEAGILTLRGRIQGMEFV